MKRPTVHQDHLRLIIEWMDEEFERNPEQGVLFLYKLRSQNESFDNFFKKKAHAWQVKEGLRQPAKIYQLERVK